MDVYRKLYYLLTGKVCDAIDVLSSLSSIEDGDLFLRNSMKVDEANDILKEALRKCEEIYIDTPSDEDEGNYPEDDEAFLAGE